MINMESESRIVKEFPITDNLGLRLVKDHKVNREKTVIVINGYEITQCMYLLMQLDTQEAEESNDYVNIDEMAMKYGRNMEHNASSFDITAEEEFWGHCSNIQAWVENDYNPCCLHSSLSVPLLTLLAKTDIKIFHMLLYHLDDMWKQYKTMERKLFVYDKFCNIVNDCIELYDLTSDDVNNSVFIRVVLEVKFLIRLEKFMYDSHNRIHYHFAREAELERLRIENIERKKRLSFTRRRNYWERKIWGSSKGHPEVLRHRKWLRELRNCNVSVVSPIEDYPAFAWAKPSACVDEYGWYQSWRPIDDRPHSLRGQELIDCWKREGITHYLPLRYEFCFSNGWAGSSYLQRVMARFEDGSFALRHLVF